MKIGVDFETFSERDIKDGAYLYASHPSTELLCAVFILEENGGEYRYDWRPGEALPDWLLSRILSGCILEAHNAQFEYLLWRFVATPKYGWPAVPYSQFRCTMIQAATLALPRGLEKLAEFLGIPEQKDMSGSRLMQKLSKPNKDGKRVQPTEEEFKRLVAYCGQDVVTQLSVSRHLRPMQPCEIIAWQQHERMNERGVRIDVELAEAAMRLWQSYEPAANERVRELTGGINATQVQALLNWLQPYLPPDRKISSLAKPILTELLEDPWFKLYPHVQEVLQIRLELGAAALRKYPKFLACADPFEHRVRYSLAFHGASTGRAAGRLIQLQNLMRGVLKSVEDIELAKYYVFNGMWKAILDKWGSVAKVLGSLCRPTICPTPGYLFIVSDLNAIECRVGAWLADEISLLDDFANGRDPYKKMASQIFDKPIEEISKGYERNVAKAAVLGCFAADTKVVTSNGVKRIVDVKPSDKLWDGEQWVTHSGILYQGEQIAYTHAGVSATLDHLCLTANGWRPWAHVATNPRCFAKATALVNLPFSVFEKSLANERHTITHVDALAAPNASSTDTTYRVADLLAAPFAVILQQTTRSIGSTSPTWTTISTGSGGLIDSLRCTRGATTPSLETITRMATVALRSVLSGEKIEDSSFSSYRRSTVGITHSKRLTESITTKDTSPEMFVSSREARTTETKGLSGNYRSESTNWKTKSLSYEHVYDLANAGPNHRFTILTDDGPLVVHNCEYGMGAGRFVGAAWDVYGCRVDSKLAKRCVDLYRANYSNIVRLWSRLSNAAIKCVQTGQVQTAGKLMFHCDANFLYMRLPSGRDLAYYQPKIVRDAKFENSFKIRFKGCDAEKGSVKYTELWGGILLENACQAIARDVLNDGLTRVEQQGYGPVLIVHDEIVAETPIGYGSAQHVEQLMSISPCWAPDLPLAAEGFESPYYRKD